MPKGIKATAVESPIKKRVKEICYKLLYVPAPEIINLVEENLMNQINTDMVVKAHNQVLQENNALEKPVTKKMSPTSLPLPNTEN